MSTRSNVKFIHGTQEFQFYVHSDGYPSARIPDIGNFLKWNKSRNDDISYGPANYVLWTKLDYPINHRDIKISIEKIFHDNDETELHRGIGVVKPCNPEDLKDSWIEYFYIIDLEKKTVRCYEIGKVTPLYKFSFKDGFDELINFIDKDDSD